MFTYLLEKKIGKVEFVDIGKLKGHRFEIKRRSGDRSLKANICFTGNSADTVFGVIFKISQEQKRLLDAAESLDRGSKLKSVHVELLSRNEILETLVYYAKSLRRTNNLPYRWYMDFVLAGAKEHQLPEHYTSFLQSFKTKQDTVASRGKSLNAVLIENHFPRKYFTACMELLEELNALRKCLIHIPNQKPPRRRILLQKHVGMFHFLTHVTASEVKLQNELFPSGNKVVISNQKMRWLVHNSEIQLRSVDYDPDKNTTALRGRINEIQSSEFIENGKAYFRLMIPITERLKNQTAYQRTSYTLDYEVQGGLSKLEINGSEFHFYDTRQIAIVYAIIDCVTPLSFAEFKKACECILVTCAHLTGNFNTAGQAYFFSYDEGKMEQPTGILNHLVHKHKQGKFGIFTSLAPGQALANINNADGSLRGLNDMLATASSLSCESFTPLAQALYNEPKMFWHLLTHLYQRDAEKKADIAP